MKSRSSSPTEDHACCWVREPRYRAALPNTRLHQGDSARITTCRAERQEHCGCWPGRTRPATRPDCEAARCEVQHSLGWRWSSLKDSCVHHMAKSHTRSCVTISRNMRYYLIAIPSGSGGVSELVKSELLQPE